jgi:tetratricopeptide (TPR) repeat protein/tRNA A-37 threonylcarbamoyl transferase component Bud32
LERLLLAASQAGSFLESPALGSTPDTASSVMERPGAQIGRYKLLQQIGEGGMGVVYMAEQVEPVKRRVALKVVKPGLDTRQVIARFEGERQALAMMDHPSIAKVLDAGATESGRPYFVMELVNGLPVTKYCDERRLTTRERLELFAPICHAVRHAHLKGVIHRDLKPSNILIALYDGRPVPKIIDFGVAKATCQTLTETTMFTQFGQLIGTLDCMSPEQAERNQLDVDTRSDIYSLGVVLYELLTGEIPFDRGKYRCAGFDEILRIIREDEPPPPSTRLSTSAKLPTVAMSRNAEPAKLSAVVRGELDWIVMKALEKERGRRYQTANDLAADIDHYLAEEPVEAGPPSAAYRFRKLVLRNQVAVLAGTTILLTLIGAVVVTTWQALRAAHQRDRAVEAEVLATNRLTAERQARREATAIGELLQTALESANPEFTKGSGYTVRQLLDEIAAGLDDRFRNDPSTEAAMRSTIGNAYRRLGLWEHAHPHLQRALELREQQFGPDHVEVARPLYDMAYNTMYRCNLVGAEVRIRRALAIYDSARIRNNDTAAALILLQLILVKADRPAESAYYGRRALSVAREQAETTAELASILTRLSHPIHLLGDDVEAVRMAREAVDLHRTLHGDNHPDTAWGLCQLGYLLSEQREYIEAEKCLNEAGAIFSMLYGDISYAWRSVLEKQWNLYQAVGDESKLNYLRADVSARIRRTIRRTPRDDESIISAVSALSLVGDTDGAAEIAPYLMTMTLSRLRESAGDVASFDDLIFAVRWLTELGSSLHQNGRFAESETAYRSAYILRTRAYGYGDAAALASLRAIVDARGRQARTADDQIRYAELIEDCS